MLIGTVKGPGEKPQEYFFITSDNDQSRIGEFVYYKIDKHSIIGNITNRRLIKNLPDDFLANPDISPQSIAELIGLENVFELYEITVSTIGYYDEKIGDFINPRIPPKPGQTIYLASNALLSKVLSPKQLGDIGAAHLGSLLTRNLGDVPIVLSIKDVVATHLAILASTGAGKSYTASVLIEELLRPNNRAAILIVDPHGEYNTLREIEALPEFESLGYKPQVKILLPDRVRVRFNTLKMGDIRYLLPEMTDKQNYYLNRGFYEVEKRFGKQRIYGFRDLYDAILEMKYDDEEGNSKGGSNISTIEAILWKLDFRFGQSKIFSDVEHNLLTELFRPGQCTVLQLNEIDQQEQQVIVGALLRRINEARVSWVTQKNLNPNQDDQLPFPVFVLLEEAHRFAPANATVVSTNILKQILSEGRKFGVGIGLITQRPGKLDQDVLSQCQTQFIMRIVNPMDQNTIASTVENIGRKMLEELPALTKGQVVVTGVGINTPVMCQVRSRLTTHGGQTFDAPSEWLNWHSASKQQSLKQEQSILIKSGGKKANQVDGFDI
ncbi:MAG: ATP-binding protein [Acidobacteria bacterium]|nr:ATP-binding protein [Acidobacteriota bacterium]